MPWRSLRPRVPSSMPVTASEGRGHAAARRGLLPAQARTHAHRNRRQGRDANGRRCACADPAQERIGTRGSRPARRRRCPSQSPGRRRSRQARRGTGASTSRTKMPAGEPRPSRLVLRQSSNKPLCKLSNSKRRRNWRLLAIRPTTPSADYRTRRTKWHRRSKQTASKPRRRAGSPASGSAGHSGKRTDAQPPSGTAQSSTANPRHSAWSDRQHARCAFRL